MFFKFEITDEISHQTLYYFKEDYSFDMDPAILSVNYSLILNKLNLSVNDHNYVVQIWGFCPYGNWIRTEKNVPDNNLGRLLVTKEVESDFSCSLNSTDWPIFINQNTGWVCIGNKDATNVAMQFIKNCVAVLDNNGQLEALWLKPQFVPSIN